MNRALLPLAVLAACRGNSHQALQLVKVELPGATIELPADSQPDPWERSPSAYAEGQLQVRANTGADMIATMVFWRAGKLWSDSEIAQAKGSGTIEPERPITLDLGTLHGRTFHARAKGHPAIVTELECGARRFEIWTASEAADLEAVQRRIAATVKCHPDAGQEGKLAGADLEHAIGKTRQPRFDVAERSAWAMVRQMSKDGVVLLADARGSSLMALAFEHEPTQRDLELLLGNDTLQLGSGSPRPVHGTMNGAKVRGALSTLDCGGDGWIVAMYLEADDARADTSPGVIGGVRCLAPGAPDVAWRDR